MSLNRISCPECGTGLKSSTGFSAGQLVSCPKCETEFTVDESTPVSVSSAGDAEEVGTRSYKNSWMRFAVLGGLLVVLAVLGYMLYDKKMKENKETVNKDPEGDAPLLTPRLVGQADPRLKPAPVGLGGVPGKAPDPAPKGKQPTADDFNRRLVGNWEYVARGETHAVAYAADGTYAYSVTKTGQPQSVTKGKWKIEGVTRTPSAAGGPPELTLSMQWTADGKPAVNEAAVLTQDGTLRHKVLVPIDEERPEGLFNRKPG